MPKLTGPMFSLEARKDLGKAITFQRRPGGASVYGYKKPKVPLTTAQHTQRDKIRWCVLSWRMLSDEAKAEWEAKAKGQGQSGYSYFVSKTCGYVYDPRCTLYLPLYSEDLKGNSFLSRDSYGRTCTVTNAVWTSQGRTFAGADYIDCGNFNPCGDSDKQFTAIFWAKGATLGSYFFTKYDYGEGERSFFIQVAPTCFGACFSDDGSGVHDTHAKDYLDKTDYTDSELRVFAVTFNGNLADNSEATRRLKLFVNGVRCVDGDLTKTHDADITTIYNSAAKVLVGARENNSVVVDPIADGTIGEVWGFDEALSAGEIAVIINRGQWRYA